MARALRHVEALANGAQGTDGREPEATQRTFERPRQLDHVSQSALARGSKAPWLRSPGMHGEGNLDELLI